MAYLILGAALLVGGLFVLNWFAGADPKRVARTLKWIAIGAGGLLLLWLLLSGRLASAMLAALALAPMLLRWRSVAGLMRNRAKAARGPTTGQGSSVETGMLRVHLDHDSGEIDGTVIAGRYEGARLADLALEDLIALLSEAQVHDPQSAAIIETYLDRVESPDWREKAAAAGRRGAGDGRAGAASSGGRMSREEAYAVLGLEADATVAQIREAHHRMMKANHPDHGGSTFIAAKINEAKEVLLDAP